MKTILPFFRTVIDSFNPNAYEHLTTRKPGDALHYLISLLFICIFFLGILAIPKIAALPSALNVELSKITDIDATVEQTIMFPEENPVIVITNEDYDGDYTLLISDDIISYQPSTLAAKYLIGEKKLSKDIEGKRKAIANVATVIAYIMLPGLALFILIGYFIKYMITVWIVSLIAFVIMRFTKYKIALKYITRIAIYSITVMAIAEIVVGYLVNLYFIPFLLFLAYLVIGIILNAEMLRGQTIGDKNKLNIKS